MPLSGIKPGSYQAPAKTPGRLSTNRPGGLVKPEALRILNEGGSHVVAGDDSKSHSSY